MKNLYVTLFITVLFTSIAVTSQASCNGLTLTAYPLPVNSYAGDTAVFTVVTNGTSIQWLISQGNGFSDVVNGGQYSGANTDSLKISNLTLTDTNLTFLCVASLNGCSDTTSYPAPLSVNPAPCTNPVAVYLPGNFAGYDVIDMMDTAAQVFTATNSATNIYVDLQLSQCKQNGPCDALLQLVTLTAGEPNLDDILGSDTVHDAQIYALPGCSIGTYGTSTFEFDGVNIVQGTQYALVLYAVNTSSGGLNWRLGAGASDPSGPYNGGASWAYMGFGGPQQSSNALQFDVCKACSTTYDTLNTGICQGDTLHVGAIIHTTPGNYTDTIINAGGCDSIVSVTLAVYLTPVPVITERNDTLYTSGGYTNYNWYLDSTLLTTNGTDSFYAVTQNGIYYVTGFNNTQHCLTSSAADTITSVGIDNISKAPYSLSVYPNPANNEVNLTLTGLGLDNELVIKLYDITGKLLSEKRQIPVTANFKTSFNLNNYEAGFYMVEAQQGSGSLNVKLAVIK